MDITSVCTAFVSWVVLLVAILVMQAAWALYFKWKITVHEHRMEVLDHELFDLYRKKERK